MAALRVLSLSGAPRARRRLALLAAAVLAGATLLAGHTSLGRFPTSEPSEKTMLREAKRMVAGKHRFGIVRYTHYPNGPTYAAAAMARVGLGTPSMRVVPLAASALCLGFMVYALMVRTRRLTLQAWTLAACCVLAAQPAFLYWQGALHEHSYALSLAFFAIGASALLPPRNGWLLFPLGFVAGWIGYDWLPGQALVVLGTRWLVRGGSEEATPTIAAAGAVLDAAKFVSGAALAVLAHLAQLALFFESWEAAARDLLGSAALRAGAEQASRISPEYSENALKGAAHLQQVLESRPGFAARLGSDFSANDPQRFRLPGLLFQLFLEPRWSIAWLLAATGAVGLLATIREGVAAVRARASSSWLGSGAWLLAVAGIAISIALAAGVTWVVLMPQHGATHLHMLPRHLLMTVAALIAIPALLVAEPGESTFEDGPTLRAMVRPLRLYAAFPVLAACAYLYALLALD